MWYTHFSSNDLQNFNVSTHIVLQTSFETLIQVLRSFVVNATEITPPMQINIDNVLNKIIVVLYFLLSYIELDNYSFGKCSFFCVSGCR
jgi:hypothetical protein